MTQHYPPLSVKVWGEFACFTRPEMKVERVSYPVPTASAARGILEAIFWRPQFVWQVEAVWVLQPIRFISIMRNEVTSRASERRARRWLERGGSYDLTGDRTQRHTLALRDVAYIIRAQVRVRPGIEDHPAKFRDQFRRRLQKGQCFTRPYLGCREFAAFFGEPDGRESAVDVTRDLGLMLLGLTYDVGASGRGTPRFFRARMEGGVVRFPSWTPLAGGEG